MFGIGKNKQKREERIRDEEERFTVEEERIKNGEEENHIEEKSTKRNKIIRYFFIAICALMALGTMPSFSAILFAAITVLLIPIKQIDDLWENLLKGKSRWIKVLILVIVFVVATEISPASDEQDKISDAKQTESTSNTKTELKNESKTKKETKSKAETKTTTETESESKTTVLETETTTKQETVSTTETTPETEVTTEAYIEIQETTAPPESKAPEQSNVNYAGNTGNSNAAVVDSNNADNGSVVVHITDSGKKYHRAGCRYLKQSDSEVTLDTAKSLGLSPCSVCNPPQ